MTLTTSPKNSAAQEATRVSEGLSANVETLVNHPALQSLLSKVTQQQPGIALATAITGKQLKERELELILLMHCLHSYCVETLQPHPDLHSHFAKLRILLLSITFIFKREKINAEHPVLSYYHSITQNMAVWSPTPGKKTDIKLRRFENQLSILDSIKNANSHEATKTLAQLHKELSEQHAKELARSEKLETRLIDSEAGSRTIKEAENTVAKLFNEHLAGSPLTAPIQEFAYENLRREMQYLFINHGRGATQYRLWEKTVKILGWLFKTDKTAEQKRQLSTVLPNHLELLNNTIKPLTYPQENLDEFVREINFAFFSILQQQSITCVQAPAIESSEDRLEDGITISRQALEQWKDIKTGDWFEFQQEDQQTQRVKLIHQFVTEDTFLFSNSEGLKAFEKTRKAWIYCLASGMAKPIASHLSMEILLNKAAQKSQNLLKKLKADTEEIRLERERQLRIAAAKAQQEADMLQNKEQLKRKQALEQRASITPEQQQHGEELVSKLRTGDWVDYNDGEKTIRGKLAVHLLSSNKYIFTDRLGSKLLELSREQLIEQITLKTITIHGGGISFEDQLAKVVSTLRKN